MNALSVKFKPGSITNSHTGRGNPPVQGKPVTVNPLGMRASSVLNRCPIGCRRLPSLCAQADTGRGDRGLLGQSTGGGPGEQLMERLGIPIIDDTILRHFQLEGRATISFSFACPPIATVPPTANEPQNVRKNR